MTDKPYEITEARLKALSPSAQRLAKAAIELGIWRIIDESKSVPAMVD
jgi:hypothetical protein